MIDICLNPANQAIGSEAFEAASESGSKPEGLTASAAMEKAYLFLTRVIFFILFKYNISYKIMENIRNTYRQRKLNEAQLVALKTAENLIKVWTEFSFKFMQWSVHMKACSLSKMPKFLRIFFKAQCFCSE